MKNKSSSIIFFLFFSVSLCLCVGNYNASAAEPRVLTLDQALAIAMDKNRDIEKAREYARLVQGKYVEERSAALPQLSLNGSASLAKDESQGLLLGRTPRQYSRTVDLTLSQPLYTWGKVGAAIRAAEQGLKTADEQLRLYRQAAYRDVSTTFYDILLAKDLHKVAVENLEQKRRHLDEAKRRYAAGVATDYDVLAAEVTVKNAGPDVIKTEHAVTTARERLRFLLALDEREVEVTGTLEGPVLQTVPYADALATAGKERPELVDLRYRIGMYSELVSVAGADDKPRLDLKAGAGWHWLDVRGGGMSADAAGAAWSAGVYLSFPFFDGLKTRGRVIQAESEVRSRKIEEARLLDTIALEVRTAGDAVREAAEIAEALAGTVRQAERLLRMAESGFELGVKVRLDVDDAMVNLLQAKTNLAKAARDYRVAMVNYAWAMGVAGEQNGTESGFKP